MNIIEQPVSTDLETLLESLSFDLMKDNIIMQIENQIPSTTDFLSTVISKFRYILEMDGIADDGIREIRYQIVDFCDELINKITSAYSLGINQVSDDYETKIEILETLYNFLIISRVSNTERFILSYINRYKDQIIETMGLDDKNKDITSFSAKKKNISRENICILSQLTEVINFIRQNHVVDPIEFISLINDGELYTDRLLQYYQDSTIFGDFTGILLNDVLDDDYDNGEIARIRNNIRIALYE